MQLIWPNNIRFTSEGYLLGRRTDRVICVLSVVENWQTVQAIMNNDRLRAEDTSGASNMVMQVVGRAGKAVQAGKLDERDIQVVVRKGSLTNCTPSMQIIRVDPPDRDRLRYLTVSPPPSMNTSSISAQILAIQDGYGVGCPETEHHDAIAEILEMTNSVRDAQKRIDRIIKSSSNPQSSTTFFSITSEVMPLLSLILIPISTLLHLVVQISNRKIPLLSSMGTPLGSVSATLSQLALRSQQVLQAPKGFKKALHIPGVSVQDRSRRYMRFWNTVWLILNDLILGYCAYQLLTHNTSFLSHHIPRSAKRFLADEIISSLNWLNDWPVGLKLNTPLSQFYTSILGSFIGFWREMVIPRIERFSPSLITVLAFASLGGLTLFLALLEDIVMLITIHLRLCDGITRGICRWQLVSLSGLWNLFRGKRWNVLRQRTDSYQYDVDQLFLGTLLFTVSAFLFPTVLTYAGLFYAISLTLWAIGYTLRTFRKALNSFPLFELLLRVKEPSRLPAGIHFVLRSSSGKDGSSLPYLELKNSPRSLGSN